MEHITVRSWSVMCTEPHSLLLCLAVSIHLWQQIAHGNVLAALKRTSVVISQVQFFVFKSKEFKLLMHKIK